MKTFKLTKKEISFKELKLSSPNKSDYEKLLKEYGMYELEDGQVILYIGLDTSNRQLSDAFENITYYKSVRTNGLKTHSALLGYKPRNKFKNNFCSIAGMSYNHPLEHELFLKTSEQLANIYKKYFPETYSNHIAKLNEETKDGESLLTEYIIENTPFTSGIVNKNNELKYHYDKGNLTEVLSAMIVIKKDIVGGYLCLPEYGVAFELANNSALFFDGQKILHGVTPIYKTTKDAYRYSAVFYTLKDMWQCLTIDEELKNYRTKTEKTDAK